MNELDSIFNEDWSESHKSGVIAIIGRPNVGKSTLINAILGQKIAIVTPTPQTTRRQQLGIYTREDVQILFVDTPGIHDPFHKLGEFMVRVAETSFRDADAILWVLDISMTIQDEDRHIAKLLNKVNNTPIILALNKVDLLDEAETAARIEEFSALVNYDARHIISAMQGTGIDDLMEVLIEHMPLGPRYYPKDQVSEVNLRYIAAEVVREKVLLNTHDEIPHAVAVGIDTFEEKSNGKYEIHATIYVERESQKGIIIGSKGSMIKRLGIEARQDLNETFGSNVSLFLHVKVLKNWRTDDRSMRRFGYYVNTDN